jgi:hypothetical protein
MVLAKGPHPDHPAADFLGHGGSFSPKAAAVNR